MPPTHFVLWFGSQNQFGSGICIGKTPPLLFLPLGKVQGYCITFFIEVPSSIKIVPNNTFPFVFKNIFFTKYRSPQDSIDDELLLKLQTQKWSFSRNLSKIFLSRWDGGTACGISSVWKNKLEPCLGTLWIK